MLVPVPMLEEEVGSGDVLAKVLEWLGIGKWDGCGCEERQQWMNERVVFAPREVGKS